MEYLFDPPLIETPTRGRAQAERSSLATTKTQKIGLQTHSQRGQVARVGPAVALSGAAHARKKKKRKRASSEARARV